jgi:hypothetical protein
LFDHHGHKHRSGSLSYPETFWGGKGPLSGPSVQEVEGFIVTKSGADSIQTAILRQTAPDRIDWLLRLLGDRFQLAIDIFVGNFDLLAFGDLIEY